MPEHKAEYRSGPCKACGAVQSMGSWLHPRTGVEVSKDCDEARTQIYPKSTSSPPPPLPPNLTPAQIERLAFLVEECGELIQAASKILRHGLLSAGYTNRQDLEREMGDVIAAITMLHKTNDVDMDRIEKRVGEKMISVKKYMHHQE